MQGGGFSQADAGAPTWIVLRCLGPFRGALEVCSNFVGQEFSTVAQVYLCPLCSPGWRGMPLVLLLRVYWMTGAAL